MRDRSVVLVGSPLDAHVAAVAEGLQGRGADVAIADTLSFPEGAQISLGERLDTISIVEETTLPDEVLRNCLRAADLLGMRWTGMDLRSDSAGTLRFLELNSSPMFLGFDARAGTKILESLVNRLASHTS